MARRLLYITNLVVPPNTTAAASVHDHLGHLGHLGRRILVWAATIRTVDVVIVVSLALLLAPAAVPLAHLGFPHGHDAPAHIANQFRFDRALWQGQLPVRWVQGLAPGFGQPLFNFYQVGFYYLVEVLHALGLPLSNAFKLTPVLLFWTAACFTWCWLRPFGRAAAYAGTISLALSPYLVIDLYVRAAYPELTAIVCIIGILWTSDAYLRDGGRGYLAACAAMVALALVSHLPATLIGSPLVVAQVPLRRTTPMPRRRLGLLLLAFALGGGLAAFYVVPALAEMPFVNMARLTTGDVDYRNNFVASRLWAPYFSPSTWNPSGASVSRSEDLLPIHVSLVQWVSLAAGVTWLATRSGRSAHRFETCCIAGWITICAGGLFMSHAASAPIWRAVPPLAFLQFPWRFFLLISIAGAGLSAVLVSRIRSTRVRTASVAGLVLIQALLYLPQLRPPNYLPRVEMNIDSPGWMAGPIRRVRPYEEPGYDPVGAPGVQVPARWSSLDDAEIEVVHNSDARMELRVISADAVSGVRLNIPYFPGWRFAIDGCDLAPPRAIGDFVTTHVPAGTHLVSARFTNTRIRSAANTISLLSLFGMAIAFDVAQRRRGRQQPR